MGSSGDSPSRMKVFMQDDCVGRRKPASGVFISSAVPTIVFVTVCSEKRVPWIAQEPVHELLKQAWLEADAWLVGYYQLMPDHVHLFTSPHNPEIPLDRWMKHWKRLFTLKAQQLNIGRASVLTSPIQNPANWKWQSSHWDTRLPRSENYTEKWHYIRENPLKEKLVENVEDWPYQGMLSVLRW